MEITPASPKFRLLSSIKSHNRFKKFVPDFWLINKDFIEDCTQLEKLDFNRKYILRSSLKNESTLESLNSGVSKSINFLDSKEALRGAFIKVIQQRNLCDIVLQSQVEWEDHYTGAFHEGLIYLEKTFNYKSDKDTSVTTHNTYSGTLTYNKNIHDLIFDICHEFKLKTILFEIGIKNSKPYIFQIVETPIEKLKYAFQGGIPSRIFKDQPKEKVGIFNFTLKMIESLKYKRVFKSKFNSNLSLNEKIDLAFKNWDFISNYYNIYCIKFRKRLGPDSWVSFCSFVSSNKHWFFSNVLDHFEIANQISSNPDVLAGFKDEWDKPYYLGSGTLSGKIGEDFIMMEELSPEAVINFNKKVILTQDPHLLSHSFLQAVERNVFLVSNLPNKIWDQLAGSQFITIDFINKELSINRR